MQVTKDDHWSAEGDDDTVFDVVTCVHGMEHEHDEEMKKLKHHKIKCPRCYHSSAVKCTDNLHEAVHYITL